MGLMKFCKRCNEDWPADKEFFFKDASCRDGLSPYCRACFSEMPSMIRKAEQRTRPTRMSSPWEVLFPEYKESRV